MMTPDERLQSISNNWFLREPVLLMTFLSHELKANPGIKTIRCGMGRIEYNSAYIANLTDSRLEERLKAEVIRILLRHPYRQPPHYHIRLSYMASNITLNEYYPFSNLECRASDYWQEKDYQKQTFEFYYRELSELFNSSQGDGKTDSGIADTDNSDGSNAESAASDQADDDASKDTGTNDNDNGNTSNDNDGDSNAESTASDQAGDDSSKNTGTNDNDNGNTGNDNDGNSNDNDTGGTGKTAPPKTPYDEGAALWGGDEFMDAKISGIIMAAQQSRSWGTLPGNILALILATLSPKIDYRKIINGFRASVLSSEKKLTRFKPSRRYGFLYMGKKSAFTTNLLAGIDVSGSISDRDLNLFYSTINRFFKYGIQSIDVLQFDTEIKGKPISMKKARKEIVITGRGGTDFNQIIEYFSKNTNTYNGLIIFTDGNAEFPHVTPTIAHKVLWICVNEASYNTHHEWMCKIGRCCWIEE